MSPTNLRTPVRVLFATLLALLLPAALASPVSADVPGGSVVSDNPANNTPHVLNGRVYSVVQVGGTIVLGGTFTRARNEGSDTELTRNRLLAFDATTGQILPDFAPSVGAAVRVVRPTGDGSTVYVGGDFDAINGEAHSRLARVRLSDGQVVDSFDAGEVTGRVRDLRLSDGQLWMAGAFTHIDGNPQRALATVDPDTGAFSDYMSMEVDGTHNGGYTQVLKIDVTPDGNRLVAVGNFTSLDGSPNDQLMMLDVSGGSAAPSTFRTEFYTSECHPVFDSYMRDVDFAPGGDFFVVTTTGAYRGSDVACDTSARFETGAAGPDVEPSWVDYTGGDTTYGVEVTPGAVYVGGHFRWQNNPYAGDRAGQGAVSREGIAALDPVNGLPLSWNPGRTKGVGVFDFLYTDQGLWAVSDTDRIGNFEYHGRVALLPRAGGSTYPAQRTPQLPETVYIARNGLDAADLESGGGATSTTAEDGPEVWDNVNGAFMVGGDVYLAREGGAFVRRTFDGQAWGAATPVDTADQLVELQRWDDDIASMTGMFLDDGRIYYTLQGDNQLYYRYFTPESGVVGAKRLEAAGATAGIDFAAARGIFLAGSRMYFADASGVLRSMAWDRGSASGAPVAGTTRVESGPGTDGVNWASNDLFVHEGPDVGPGPSNEAPTARMSVTCDDLTCTFDGRASSDPDGTLTGYAWDFGDGSTDSGALVEHQYASAGERTVQLTVTDDANETDSATGTANPQDPGGTGGGSEVSLVGATNYNDDGNSHSVTVPSDVQAGDTLVLHAGMNTTNADLGDPNGWTTLSSTSGGNFQGRTWTRQATAGDAGSSVTVSTTGWVKVDLSMAAYRGAGGEALQVLDHAAALDQQGGTDHVSPTVDNPTAGSWLETSWIAKRSADITWSLPASQQRRVEGHGSGGGRLNTVLSDTDGPAPTGQVGGLTGTTSIETGHVLISSTVIGPSGGTTTPTNEAPTARMSVTCDDLTCTFDGRASGDPDGTLTGYAWDFGDGNTDSGALVEHDYASAGSRPVELTVTDDGGETDTATGTANPQDPGGTGGATGVALVGAAGYNGSNRNHSVVVPADVQAGDTLLLHAAVNDSDATLGDPAGWTTLDSPTGSNFQGRSWTRQATAGDPGSTVTVTTSSWVKVDLSVAGYRGQGGSLQVLDHASSLDQQSGTDHVSPTVDNPTAGSWLVTSWVAKRSADLTWSIPASQQRRVEGHGAGGGRLTSVLADSGGQVPTGQVGGLTGTTSSEVSRVVMFSTVVGPG